MLLTLTEVLIKSTSRSCQPLKIDNFKLIRHIVDSLSQKEKFQWLTAKKTYFKGLLKPVGGRAFFAQQYRFLLAKQKPSRDFLPI
jgi:hypothetical protein